MEQTKNNIEEKPTPFLKRVANIENDVSELNKQIEVLTNKLNTVIKSLTNRG